MFFMKITRHGKNFLKLVFADKTIAVNPISKNSKEKVVKFGADISVSTVFHPDFNGFEQVEYNNKKPFIIKGGGEYEISDIFIKGYGLKQKYQDEDKMITSYTILLDGINVAVFGPISSGDNFSNEAFEEFASADIFVVPIGGGDVFTPKDAAKFIKQFSPKIVIPVHYDKKDELEEFAAALGVEAHREDKLTIKQKDLPEEIAELVELKIV